MAGSKPAALPLGYAPTRAFCGARGDHSRSPSLIGPSPVVDCETKFELAMREVDAPRHEHARLSARKSRELVGRQRRAPLPLLEGRERPVRTVFAGGPVRRIREAEQPRMQAADRQPPA